MRYRTQFFDEDISGSLQKQFDKFAETHPRDKIRLVTVMLYPTTPGGSKEFYRAIWELSE